MEKKVNNEKVRIYYLDFLKAIAITLVVFCHYVWIPDNSFLGNVLMLLAWSAVPCFFMVNGWTNALYEGFCMEKIHKKNSENIYWTFCMEGYILDMFWRYTKKICCESIVGIYFFLTILRELIQVACGLCQHILRL